MLSYQKNKTPEDISIVATSKQEEVPVVETPPADEKPKEKIDGYWDSYQEFLVNLP